jgi:hypothetical protein
VYEKLNNGTIGLGLEETMDQYSANMRKLLKEKLYDEHVYFYIESTSRKLAIIANLIKHWTQVNDENKFLMSITDDELENYVNNINTNGIAVTETSLTGTWTSSPMDESYQFEFRKDHTYSYVANITSPANLNFSQGKLKRIYKEAGTWEMKGDTIIAIADADSVDFEMDASMMTVQPEKQEMLDNWVQNFKEESITFYQKEIKEGHARRKWCARLDTSHDKMELKADESVVYYKREK